MYVSSQQHHYLKQIRQIMTHPFFTGECPECKQNLQLVDRVIGQSHCPVCGWTDEPED
jgi:transcription initiation factor IIE alpha subunit